MVPTLELTGATLVTETKLEVGAGRVAGAVVVAASVVETGQMVV